MSLAAAIDWNNVLLALIAALPGIITAVLASRIHSQIQTPSGMPIGHQVEDTNHTARANFYSLDSIGNAVSATPSPDAHAEAQRTSDPPKPNGVTPPPQ